MGLQGEMGSGGGGRRGSGVVGKRLDTIGIGERPWVSEVMWGDR